MRQRKERLWILLAVVIGIVLMVLGFSRTYYGDSLKIENDGVQYFDWDWRVSSQGQEIPIKATDRQTVKLDVAPNVLMRLERVLPKAFNESKYIAVRASLQSIRVLLDEDEMYVHGDFSDLKGYRPVASAWHIIKMPGHATGKTLSIELLSPYGDMSGVINPIFFGSHGDISIEIIKKHIDVFIPAVLMTVLGIGMLLFSVLFKLPNRMRFAYLGLFAMALGLWMVSESRFIQFITGSNFYIASSAYLMLSLFPIPLLLFVRDYIAVGFKKHYTLWSVIFAFNTVFILLAALGGLYGFYETVRWTHVLIFLASVMLIGTLLYEIRLKRNEEAVHFTQALVLLAIFGIIEIIHFNFFGVITVSYWVRIGFLLFVVMLIAHSSRQLLQLLKANVEATYYQKLAYEDRVTAGPNRTAFDEDVKKYFVTPELLIGLRLVIFDLNGLKVINDVYGHNEGDNAIKLAFECIDKTFGRVGKCYRIGGDEFACLLSGRKCDETVYEQLKIALNRCVEKVDETLPYDFGISYGETIYDSGQDQCCITMMYRADQKMYEDKKRRK